METHTHTYRHFNIPPLVLQTSYIVFVTKTEPETDDEGKEQEEKERKDLWENKNHDGVNNSHHFCSRESHILLFFL